MKIPFITGNQNKFYEALESCKKFGIELEQVGIDVDEIQHSDGIKIAEAKAKSAYEKLQRPLVINDQTWEIPALGGFPGAYMKDVSKWLTTEDFMNLMKDKKNKSIFLHETVVYYDGQTMNIFSNSRPGHFISEPRGESHPPHGRVVELDCDKGLTISEVIDKGNWDINEETHTHWFDFAKWYAKT